jgi:hypothetical protein
VTNEWARAFSDRFSSRDAAGRDRHLSHRLRHLSLLFVHSRLARRADGRGPGVDFDYFLGGASFQHERGELDFCQTGDDLVDCVRHSVSAGAAPMLVYLGQNRLIRFFVKVSTSRVVDEVVRAAQELSRLRYGGLIVLARDDNLKTIVETGIKIQAEVSAALMVSLFSPKSPLHDGAVVIENDVIVTAKCILPLTQNDSIDKRLGTRHRAAVGLAEESDAVVLIVSEETGKISIAMDERLLSGLSLEEAENILNAAFRPQPNA